MGTVNLKTKVSYTPEAYLTGERESEVRHEYIDGEIYEMAGESLSHSRICINLAGTARAALKGTPCEPLSPNMKVRTSTASLFAYPDMTVVCGEPVFHDKKKDVLTNPKVIFEVLSPSTETYDRTTKFQRYRLGNDTLTDYVLVSQDKLFVEHFSKQPDGNWLYWSYGKAEDSVQIQSVGLALTLGDIYERVEFEREL